MSLTRRLLRFGKPIPLFISMFYSLRDYNKKPKRAFIFRTLSDISLFIYYFLDHPLYFQKLGVINMSKERADYIDWLTNVTWFLETFFNILVDLIDI